MSRRRMLGVLWSLAVLVPALVVWLGGWAFWAVTRRPAVAFHDLGLMWAHTAMVGGPFLLLAVFVAGSPRFRRAPTEELPGAWRAALLGIVVTCLLWGYSYYDGYAYWRDQRTTGVDFGIAFMMLASPLLVGVAMIVGIASGRRTRRAAGVR